MATAVMRILAIFLLTGLTSAASAQEGFHGQGHAMWHENFYANLRSPKTNFSCCNQSDCRPTSGRMVGDHYEVEVDGKWVRVPWDIILKTAAPDMGFHVCAPANFDGIPEHLYCVILPPEM